MPEEHTAIKGRKTRRDKDVRQLSSRDLWVLRWIAEMYAIRFDHLRQLLSREPGQRNHKAPGPCGLTAGAVNHVIRRWQEDPPLVQYERIYTHSPGWIWLTPHAEKLLELSYARHHIKESRFTHRHYINHVRLDIEERHPEYRWISERALLAGQPRREAGEVIPHVPDAEVWLDTNRVRAVEVELSPKSDQALDALLRELLEGETPRYQGIWYFVSDQDPVHAQAWRTVALARERLPASLQARMQIIDIKKVGMRHDAATTSQESRP